MTGIAYRPEIDGLRAIAVLAVVAYHAGLGGAGYVGVDVFFVISGYLITALLLREHEAFGRIDLVGFYARRVRRIFPAAAVLVLAVLAVSPALLPLREQVHTAWSAGAALVFFANVFFQFTSGGYFDGAAEDMPLLHLWSLSVEEQFYFVWPALLILLLRYGRARHGIVVLGLASFLLAEALTGHAAFYQMPARFWELAAGGLIAALPARRLPVWALPAGIVATLAACLWQTLPFPGFGAVPAVAGATLVVAAVHGGARNAFLASGPMVGIGLISYSLYLWHWPLLAFYRANDGQDLQTRLILCAIAFVLAFVSYRYVEQPIRRQQWPKGRTVAIGFGASAVVALSACAYGVQTRNADMGEFPLATQAERDSPARDCHSRSDQPPVPACTEGRTAVWGDSMAYAWSELGEARMTRDACPPLVGMPADAKGCAEFNRAAVQHAASMDTIYLVAKWRGDIPQQLGPTLHALRDVPRVVILGPTPHLAYSVPRCIRESLDCDLARSEFVQSAAATLEALHAVAMDYPNVEVVDLTNHFCTATACPPVLDGLPLYWDTHHVSSAQVRRVGKALHRHQGSAD